MRQLAVCAIFLATLLGCGVGLKEQQSLAQLSSAVTAQCVAAVGGNKRPVCARARACVSGIHEAEVSVQAAVEARAKGMPEETLEVQAAASVAGSRAGCAALCFGPSGLPVKGCTVVTMGAGGVK